MGNKNFFTSELSDVKPLKAGDDGIIHIKFFGVGGCGGNVTDAMSGYFRRDNIEYNNTELEFIMADTSVPALEAKQNFDYRLQIGRETAKGKGACGKIEIGERSAEEDTDEIKKNIKGASFVFIAAGIAGGTGGGATSAIADIVRSMGIQAAGLLIRPFNFEGEGKAETAERSAAKIKDKLKDLVIFSNQYMLDLGIPDMTFAKAYESVDKLLYFSARVMIESMFDGSSVLTQEEFTARIMKFANE